MMLPPPLVIIFGTIRISSKGTDTNAQHRVPIFLVCSQNFITLAPCYCTIDPTKSTIALLAIASKSSLD